jgi:ribonuclease HI
MKDSDLVIHTDGGARGNPGPSACAFVVEADGGVIAKGTKYLGVNTNNFAEYSAFVLVFDWLLENKEKILGKDIYIYSDSELVVKQLMGIYKIKNPALKILNNKIIEQSKKLGMNIFYKNVFRSKNVIADSLVNEELDKNV